ncbi:MAG TPA: hypothetical protein VFV67_25370 [Actinophytocola sp.]|uniref:hypothetical protein n=1 Tax=Actinophytocola sp. TaxID=1872138 RepID=UPI002DB9B8A7|nr:hypothetical protein [Actinophytocola sp.]HEU5473990.1 hypothetical protein [Actinophytocola sp.]
MSDRPEDVDAAFAAIVADLEREGLGADVQVDEPTTEALPVADPDAGKPEAATGEPTAPIAAAWRGHDAEWDWSWNNDEEHYVPPEPPPMPRLRPLTVLALLLVVAGVLLLVSPALVGLDPRIATPISLVALVCGFGLLFLRIRRSPADTGDDNGAQV